MQLNVVIKQTFKLEIKISIWIILIFKYSGFGLKLLPYASLTFDANNSKNIELKSIIKIDS